MKKVFAIIFVFVILVCTLAACGDDNTSTDNQSQNTAAQADNASDVSLSDLLGTIQSQFSLNDMKSYDSAADAKRYFAIEEASVKQFAAVKSKASSQIVEVILCEAADSSAVDGIKAALNSHLDAQVNNAKSYSKEQLSMVESAEVKAKGDFVYLVISEDADKIVGLIESKI